QHRIDSADRVDGQYARISAQAVRAASYRALAAEYQRDLLGEQVETAQDACDGAAEALASLGRDLAAARAGRGQLRDEHAHALALLQGREGYGEQAQLDELAGRDRDRLQQLKTALLREIAAVRERYRDTGRLGLPGVDAIALANAGAPWEAWHEALAALPGDAALPWTPAQLHAQAKAALAAAAPLVDAVDGHARGRHAAFEQARDRLESARHNLKRLAAGQAELHPDAVRLMNYLRDEGIVAQPVCDLVRVVDPAWQPAIEAYLRSNVEALLVAAQDEERAVKLYRSLRDGRAAHAAPPRTPAAWPRCWTATTPTRSPSCAASSASCAAWRPKPNWSAAARRWHATACWPRAAASNACACRQRRISGSALPAAANGRAHCAKTSRPPRPTSAAS